MNGLEREIHAAAAWLREQTSKIQYGEVTVKVVMHVGNLVRTERTVTTKMQSGNAMKLGDPQADYQGRACNSPCKLDQPHDLNMRNAPRQPALFIHLESGRPAQIIPIADGDSQDETLRELDIRAKRMIQVDTEARSE